MNVSKDKYEAVIGLEVHAQLKTNTKAYSNDENIYGAKPNSKTSVVTLGHPGTLPVSNEKVIECAVKLGIAVNANIRERNEYARKNYFYADLPKGYQITQDKTPICSGGFIQIFDENDVEKQIKITRIHMEEDAGKSIHDLDPFNSLVDLNRAGVPLLEIVSEPEIRSSNEAYQYLSEIRKLVRYLDICDGNMEEGSLRCDANISVRLKGDKKFGTKVEVKNMNSIRNVKNAIEFEINRQINLLEKGENIIHETRGYNAVNGETQSQRHKEEANDYRYFPCPDLLPVVISDKELQEIKENLPELPEEKETRYVQEIGLEESEAKIISSSKAMANMFEEASTKTDDAKLIAKWLVGDVSALLNKDNIEIDESNLSAENFGKLIERMSDNTISGKIAKSVLEEIWENGTDVDEIIETKGLVQIQDESLLQEIAKKVIDANPEQVTAYKAGKEKLFGFFVGQVMKETQGKANPKSINNILKELLC